MENYFLVTKVSNTFKSKKSGRDCISITGRDIKMNKTQSVSTDTSFVLNDVFTVNDDGFFEKEEDLSVLKRVKKKLLSYVTLIKGL
jgi:hypothetical protein